MTWASLRRSLAAWWRYIAILRTVPFSQPRIAQILYATFSGIFLSVGTDLILDLVNEPAPEWGSKHTSGILFIVASLFISGLAWSAQSFLDHLVTVGKDRANVAETSLQFESWTQRRVAWCLLFLSLAVTISAFAVLFLRRLN